VLDQQEKLSYPKHTFWEDQRPLAMTLVKTVNLWKVWIKMENTGWRYCIPLWDAHQCQIFPVCLLRILVK